MTLRILPMSARASLATALLLSLSACGSDEPDSFIVDENPGEARVSYDCEGDRSFEAVFHAGREEATLLIEGQEIVLPQVPTGSGIAFSDGIFTFHAKGLDAYTEGWRGGDYIDCEGTNL